MLQFTVRSSLKMPATSVMEVPRDDFSEAHSWTDDLPICRYSGVGYATNQVYRKDGQRQCGVFEEKCIHVCSNEDPSSVYLYGVFDGNNGVEAAEFAVQGMAAELLLGQLAGKVRDQEIKETLSQAFLSVEKNYLQSLDDKVAQRAALQYQIPEGLMSYDIYQRYPDIVDSINKLNRQLSCGTTAAVALIVNNKLYVANVGDTRVLLCKTDKHGVHKMQQLSVDHDLSNEDEILRLETIGLSIPKGLRTLANQHTTRCIGNFLVKGAFREFEELASATEEPIIAEPEIQGGIEIDESCRFLLLMSDGLYKSLEEATGTAQVNTLIIQTALEEFKNQTTLTGVAQAIVDKVVRKHTDMYFSGAASELRSRDDISLIVRNFNCLMANSSTLMATSTNTLDDTISSSTRSMNSVPTEIQPYVDFTDFYKNVEEARKNGTLALGSFRLLKIEVIAIIGIWFKLYTLFTG
uniref:PPM-type phosphatase domain-containing protein n=1 Tax=Lygus hesperus TaxID=30085 RepID=A0A0K8S3X3_LYGHE